MMFELCSFTACASAKRTVTAGLRFGLRRSIQGADQVVVICGVHTELSGRMAAELRIAQEQGRPYVLLWGRREPMCKKPTTARPADSMYSWTPEILRNQILMHRRLSAGSRGHDGATTR